MKLNAENYSAGSYLIIVSRGFYKHSIHMHKTHRLNTSIRRLHSNRLFYAGTEPATHLAQWFWRGDLNKWGINYVNSHDHSNYDFF